MIEQDVNEWCEQNPDTVILINYFAIHALSFGELLDVLDIQHALRLTNTKIPFTEYELMKHSKYIPQYDLSIIDYGDVIREYLFHSKS